MIDIEKITPGYKTVKSEEMVEYTGQGGAKFQDHDVLFARITPCLENGKTAIADIGGNKGTGSTELLVFRGIPGVSDTDYIYYLLCMKHIRQLAANSMTGASGRQRADLEFIKRIQWDFPPIEKQKKIAEILSAYDSLIEVNNKRIKVLEQMAENLYKEWFVRFRFPGHETTEFENGLPKGWERNRISKYYQTSSGGTPSRENEDNYEDGTIPWIKTGEMQDSLLIDTEEYITEIAIKTSSAKLFPPNSVLMAMYGVNIGKLAYSTMEATCNQACCVFQDKEAMNENLNEDETRLLENASSRILEVIKREDRIDKIAQDIAHHFPRRGFLGKGMVVSVDKYTTVKMYDKVQHYWAIEKQKIVQERNAAAAKEQRDELTRILNYMNRVEMAVIVSEEADENEKFQKQGLDISSHRARMNAITPEGADIEDRFKDPDDPLQLVFVCAMWLTGFDVENLSTLYLDKPMKGHTLMQAIARANRVYPNKPCGIIVDYVNVFKYMQRALTEYASGDDGTEFPAKDIDQLIVLINQAIDEADGFLMELGINIGAIVDEASYLSIIVIALLGVTTFLGIDYSAAAITISGSDYYNRVKYRDIEIISTRMLTPEDIEALRNIEGVAEVEPVWTTLANAYVDGIQCRVYIISTTESTNLPQVVDGRLPEQPMECAIEEKIAEQMGWAIGDVIETLEMLDVSGSSFMGGEPFLITGIVQHPDHTNRNLNETPYILLTPDNYNMEDNGGCCMKAELVIEKNGDEDRFGASYTAAVAAVLQRIDAIIPERTALRDAQLKARQMEQLDALNEAIEEMWLAMNEESEETEEDFDYYAENQAMYEEALRLLDKQRQAVENMEPGRWLCYDVQGNASAVQITTGSGNLTKLEMTFSLLFILIGALVIYATVGKMVDEQRTLVGAMKANGFRGGEILAKYLLFGVSATGLGMALGVLMARFFLEPFVLSGYDVYYTFDMARPVLTAIPTLTVILFGMMLSSGAVWIASRRLLRLPAVTLLQPPAPAGKARTGGGKHVLSLYSRLILANIRTDIRRVAVTVVSVAGCCALVVIGFTLKNAVEGSIRNQYPAITDFDAKVVFEFSWEEVDQAARELGAEGIPLKNSFATYRVTELRTAELLCGNIDAIGEYYRLLDWKTGESLHATDEGVLIPRRLAEIYGLEIGSEFELALGGIQTARVWVAGIFETYIGSPIVISSACFEKYFEEECRYNAYFLRYHDADEATFAQDLRDRVWGIDEVTPADANKAMFRSSTSVINAIVALFIVMAAIMAGVVLLNLTNIYILQKKRELTVMRINGFTVGEVIRYVTRETVATTAAGVLLGIAAGSWIAYRIIRSMEQPFIQFERGVSVTAWLLGAAITVLFAVFVNAVALRSVKRLKLTDMS